ncbi:YitT family protein [Mycoplasmatota bacterium]|nr:YitT family protein [Mycoplasmatota bacterium]
MIGLLNKMNIEFKKQFKDYFYITLGLFLVALEIHLFMVPNNFVTGGVSGLAIVLKNAASHIPEQYQTIHLFGQAINISFLFSLSGIMFILNTILYILGTIFIGFKFGVRTVYSGYMLNFLYYLMVKIYPIKEPLIDDLLLQLIILSVMSAAGLAIVFRHHASTGGTDITGKILNKYFHIDLGKAVLLSDLVITISAFSINGFSSFIYGLFGIFLNGLIIDYLLRKFSETKEVVIISEECDKVKEFIMYSLEKGATIYEAKGAYTNDKKEIIRSVVTKREFFKLKDYIMSIDANAFITVNDIHATFGLGFRDITD